MLHPFRVHWCRRVVTVVIPGLKSGRIRQAKSLKIFEERYHPEMSIILSPGNVKKQGSRWQVPLYAAGRMASLITRIHI